MRSMSMLLIGLVLGIVIASVSLVATDSAYVQRRGNDSTTNEDLTRWIERDNCRPVTIGDRVTFYRCPRWRF